MFTEIYESLRELREAKGLTREEAAEKVGVSLAAYGRLERGYQSASQHNLKKIAHGLGCKVIVDDVLTFFVVMDQSLVQLYYKGLE